MKGIILAGGSRTRLYPITQAVSKQLMPVLSSDRARLVGETSHGPGGGNTFFPVEAPGLSL